MGNALEEIWNHPKRVMCDPDTGRVWRIRVDDVAGKWAYGEQCVAYRVTCYRDGKARWADVVEVCDNDQGYPSPPGSERFYLSDETRQELVNVFGKLSDIPPYALIYDMIMHEMAYCTIPARWTSGHAHVEA